MSQSKNGSIGGGERHFFGEKRWIGRSPGIATKGRAVGLSAELLQRGASLSAIKVQISRGKPCESATRSIGTRNFQGSVNVYMSCRKIIQRGMGWGGQEMACRAGSGGAMGKGAWGKTGGLNAGWSGKVVLEHEKGKITIRSFPTPSDRHTNCQKNPHLPTSERTGHCRLRKKRNRVTLAMPSPSV